MAVITRRLEFDSGHRVLGHEGKCKHLHGHRYVAEITIEAPKLDSLGRVVDFGIVKEQIGGWIDKHWDHNMLLHPNDPLIGVAGLPLHHMSGGRFNHTDLFDKPPYIMELGNPTAENIAAELLMKCVEQLRGAGRHELRVTNVRIYETPNCWADCTPSILQTMVDTTNVQKELDTSLTEEEIQDVMNRSVDERGSLQSLRSKMVPPEILRELEEKHRKEEVSELTPLPQHRPKPNAVSAILNRLVKPGRIARNIAHDWLTEERSRKQVAIHHDGTEVTRLIKQEDGTVRIMDTSRGEIDPLPEPVEHI